MDGGSACFEADSFWQADGSVLALGDSVLSLSSPVFSSALALFSSLSAAFSGAGAASELDVCRGELYNRQGRRRRGGSLQRAERGVKRCGSLTDGSSWDDKWFKCREPKEDGQDVKGDLNESDGWRKKGGTHLLF